MPSPENQKLALSRQQTHAKKPYIGKRGVKEIHGHFKGNAVFLEVV